VPHVSLSAARPSSTNVIDSPPRSEIDLDCRGTCANFPCPNRDHARFFSADAITLKCHRPPAPEAPARVTMVIIEHPKLHRQRANELPGALRLLPKKAALQKRRRLTRTLTRITAQPSENRSCRRQRAIFWLLFSYFCSYCAAEACGL
jgi:hypothetical protein